MEASYDTVAVFLNGFLMGTTFWIFTTVLIYSSISGGLCSCDGCSPHIAGEVNKDFQEKFGRLPNKLELLFLAALVGAAHASFTSPVFLYGEIFPEGHWAKQVLTLVALDGVSMMLGTILTKVYPSYGDFCVNHWLGKSIGRGVILVRIIGEIEENGERYGRPLQLILLAVAIFSYWMALLTPAIVAFSLLIITMVFRVFTGSYRAGQYILVWAGTAVMIVVSSVDGFIHGSFLLFHLMQYSYIWWVAPLAVFWFGVCAGLSFLAWAIFRRPEDHDDEALYGADIVAGGMLCGLFYTLAVDFLLGCGFTFLENIHGEGWSVGVGFGAYFRLLVSAVHKKPEILSKGIKRFSTIAPVAVALLFAYGD